MIGNQHPNHPLGMLLDGSGNISILFPTQLPLYGMQQFPMTQAGSQPVWCQLAPNESCFGAGFFAPNSLLPHSWPEVAHTVNRAVQSGTKPPIATGIDFLAAAADAADNSGWHKPLNEREIEVWHGIKKPKVFM